jgi:predicted nucleic acid-binding protein
LLPIMRRLKLRDTFAFDRHFEQAGFALWPKA